MRAGVGEAEHGRRDALQQLGDDALVGVQHRQAEARLEIGRERQVEREVDRVDAALRRHLAERCALRAPGSGGALGDRHVLEARRRAGCRAMRSRKARGTRDRRRCASCRRRSACDTGLNSDMLSNGNGALNWNSKLSGRHDTCGITRTPSACSAAERSSTKRCPSGPSMPPSSAVQLTGLPVLRWMAASSSRKKPGPIVACMTPCPTSARHAASASISSSVAARLGTGRPA